MPLDLARRTGGEPAPAGGVALERRIPHATGIIHVRAVERPTAGVARVTFEGPDLAGFPDEQPGEIITLIWPAAAGAEIALPGDGWRYPPGSPGHHDRNFTIRSYDPDGPAVMVDFVLHGDHGVASAWAARARPGDRLGFAGPRIHYYDDPDAAWTLLAGDETALPSIAATLERMPAGHPVDALIEIADAADRQSIDTRAAARITWVECGADARPGPGELEQAIRALKLPATPGKVWVAGEAGSVRGIREHLRDERGLAIGSRQAIGYWKHRGTPADVERDIR